MSNIARIGLLAIVGLGLLAGCKRNPDPNQASTMPLLVDDAQIALPSETPSELRTSKVHREGFDVQDSIAFYAVRFTGTSPNAIGADPATYINHKLYIKRKVDELFASWNGTTFVEEYFPNNGSSIDIYGFYPYNKTAPTDYTNHTFHVRANQNGTSKWSYNQSDFMMAKTPAIKPTAVPNKLIFKHLLSRVVVSVRLKNFPEGSKVQGVQLLKVCTQAELNLRAYDAATGTAGIVFGSSTPINVTPYVEATPATGYDHTSVAVVAPQPLDQGKQLAEITVWDGSKSTKYNITLPDRLLLNSGEQYTFNVSIDQGSRPQIGVAPVITPWGTTLKNTGETNKASDHKFITTLSNVGVVNNIDKVTQVKVGVNGNRTFTLLATYSNKDGVHTVTWEFRGAGNRPTAYPFTIHTIEFVAADGTTRGGINTATPTTVKISANDASETVALGLTLDFSTSTFTQN